MFEEIFCPQTAKKYRAAPLVEQRERYLVYLKETGAGRLTLRKCANDQLSLMRFLKLKEGDRVSADQIEAAAAIWSRPKGRRSIRAASPKARKRFVSQGIGWLRFLVWLDEREKRSHSHYVEVATFEKWLRDERGLSGATVQSYCAAADRFFSWLVGNDVALSAVRMRHIDDAVAAEHTRGAWNSPDPARLRAASEGVLLVRRSPRLVLVGAGRGHHAAPLHGGRDRPQGREARGCRAPARVRRGRSYCRQARPGNPDAVYRLRAEGRRSRRPPAGRSGLGERDAPCPLLKAGPNASLAAVAEGSGTPSSGTYAKHGPPASGAASSSRRARRYGRSPGRRWQRWFAIAWRRSASSTGGAVRTRCGMRRPSIFWIRACR